MSNRSLWKTIHLLNSLAPSKNGLSASELEDAGINCGPRDLYPLTDNGVVSYADGLYKLTTPARQILATCVVANQRWSSDDMCVDYPSAFIVMPFSEPWSDKVFMEMIEPGVTGANLTCIRGDMVVRVGDLTQNLWGAILHAGLVVADVSVLNANVFYELGLAHALGKDTFILKQVDAKLWADIGGAHYIKYDLNAIGEGLNLLKSEVSEWAENTRAQGVKSLINRLRS